jgi:pimeloyl-ACP methyl ester carboxylesterase
VQVNFFKDITVPVIVTVMLIFATSASADSSGTPPVERADECVVLVHGLARTSHSMDDMEAALQVAGYKTVNIDYPSRSHKIQDLAARVGKQAIAECKAQVNSTIHFVTHSMGGILVRYYLAKNDVQDLGRVVMLAPPNQGSLLTDQLRDELWYKWLTGPAGQQLGTGKDGVPGMLGAVDFEAGIIAGNEHSPVDNWLAELIPGADDGKVAVDHAKVEGMQDFLVLPYTHISIMNEDEVIEQSLSFLQHGRFDHSAADRLKQTRKSALPRRIYFD